MLSSLRRPCLTQFINVLSLPSTLFKRLGKGHYLSGANKPRIQKKCCELLVYSHPRNFLSQFVSLELKSLESFLIALPPQGKHPVSVPGTHPGHAPRQGPTSSLQCLCPLQPLPTSGHFWGSLRSLLSTLKMFGMSFLHRSVFWTDSLRVAAGFGSFRGCLSSRFCHLLQSPLPDFKHLAVLASHVVLFENWGSVLNSLSALYFMGSQLSPRASFARLLI